MQPQKVTELEEDGDQFWNDHTCEYCSHQSKSAFETSNHLKFDETPKTESICDMKTLESIKCGICEFDSNLKVYLIEHLRVFHGKKEINEGLKRILKCRYCRNCDFHTYSVLVLTKHIDNCNSVFTKNSGKTRASRKQSRHRLAGALENIDWFECVQCAFKSKNEHHLKRHIIAKHTNPEDINWFRCAQCEFKTKQKGHLKQHVIAKHTNPENINWFPCIYCQFKAKRKFHLKQHLKSRHPNGAKAKDKNWFICEHCGHRTRRRGDLKRHIIVKHTDADDINWFKCEHCEFKTKQKCNLKVHAMWKHTNPEDVIWFTCGQCDYKTKQKSRLKQHVVRRHNNF